MMKKIKFLAVSQKKERAKPKMYSTFFKKNKKGFTIGIKEAVLLAFAAILVLAMFSFFFQLKDAFLSEPDDGSKTNFDRIYSSIKDLIKSSDSKDYKVINYFLADKKFIVGFDRDWDDNTNVVDFYVQGDNIYKSSKCGVSACLCLYSADSGWDKSNNKDKNVILCRSDDIAGKNVIFSSEGSENVEPRTKGIARVDGKDHYLVFDGKDWKVQRLYIEKTTIDTKIYFYISTIDTDNLNDPANKRKLEIDNLRQGST